MEVSIVPGKCYVQEEAGAPSVAIRVMVNGQPPFPRGPSEGGRSVGYRPCEKEAGPPVTRWLRDGRGAIIILSGH